MTSLIDSEQVRFEFDPNQFATLARLARRSGTTLSKKPCRSAPRRDSHSALGIGSAPQRVRLANSQAFRDLTAKSYSKTGFVPLPNTLQARAMVGASSGINGSMSSACRRHLYGSG